MDVKISDRGPVDDRKLDTLEQEVLPRVLSERGLDVATYSGYSYIRPKRVGMDAGRLCVFGAGQEIGFRLMVDNGTDQEATATFQVSVRNGGGAAVAETTAFEVVSPPRDRATRRICFSLERNGI